MVMTSAVRGLQKLERNTKVLPVIFPCFIHLQKADETVDRTLLWQVLASFGVPPQMMAVIRRLHVGMRAHVRNDDSTSLEWFEVVQGLHQGCVLSPLLFKLFIATALLVSLDADIRADLFLLRERRATVGPEKALECERRAV